MGTISKIVQPVGGFQYSVNIYYDMVATVLHKNSSEYEKFISVKQSEFERLRKTVDKYRAFDKIRGSLTDDLAKSCYPLHPYSLLLLPKISELIAQNERTIFTFLSSNERNTVPYFLRKEDSEFPLIDRDGEITEFSKATIKFRSLLNNPDINAHELLFETLFKCFNTQDPTQVVVGVRQAHKEIGENLLNYKKYILDIVKSFNEYF